MRAYFTNLLHRFGYLTVSLFPWNCSWRVLSNVKICFTNWKICIRVPSCHSERPALAPHLRFMLFFIITLIPLFTQVIFLQSKPSQKSKSSRPIFKICWFLFKKSPKWGENGKLHSRNPQYTLVAVCSKQGPRGSLKVQNHNALGLPKLWDYCI